MNIDSYADVMSSCRFCFMCRHLSATANVTFRECDTARGHALIADRVRMHPESLKDADFIQAVYDSDLSGANRFHCDGYHAGKGYDEIGLQLALRRDIVEAGEAPDRVKALVETLKAAAQWQLSASSPIAYFVDPGTAARPSVRNAVERLLNLAGVSFGIVTGGGIGKPILTLGFEKEGVAVMKKFAAFLNGSGVKTLLTSSPAVVHALKVEFPEAGIKLACEVMLVGEHLAGLAEQGRFAFARQFGKASVLPSDFRKNYLRSDGLEALYRCLGVQPVPFGTNGEESYTAGEGALVLGVLNPALVEKLAARVARFADAEVPVIVESPHTALALEKAGMRVCTVEEAAAACAASTARK